MTDIELVIAARTDRGAQEKLISEYTPLVKAVAARFFIRGGEPEDLEQEGMFGLISAINTFTGGGANFSSYVYACVRNAILDAVKKSVGAKHSALNDFVPIIEIGDETVPDTPEDELIMREQRREFLQKISKELSALEFKATVMRLDGMGSGEIAEALGKPLKSISNALARAKAKLEKLYREG